VQPQTRFVRSHGTDLAYQVVGAGEPAVVATIGWVSHLEQMWELPELRAFLDRLAGIGRLVVFDKRGTGMSDRVPRPVGLDDMVDDLVAVMDAAGVEQAVLLGWLEGAATALATAARHPDRVLQVVAGEPVGLGPGTIDPAMLETVARAVEEAWGTGAMLSAIAPSVEGDPRVTAWWGRWERLSATPNLAANLLRAVADVDVTDLLAQVRCPTLVLHRRGVSMVTPAGLQRLTEHVSQLRLVELEGADVPAFFGDVDAVYDEIEEFCRGTRSGGQADRWLGALLVTDVVGSTARAARGDAAWRADLVTHRAQVRDLLGRYGGTEVDTAGDGFLCTFPTASAAVRCATAVVGSAAGQGLAVRAGVHVGEVLQQAGAPTGVAVHVAARVAAGAQGGQVLVSDTVALATLGVAGVALRERGETELHGVPGRWRLHEVVQDPGPPRTTAPAG
jgi:pimeloyl-ACP methyl ester carboxylesterase